MPGSVAAALVVLCTPGGEVLECRRDDLGAGAAEAVGRPFSTVVDGSSVQRVERLFGDIREEGASFNRDLRVKLRDGRRETVHVMGGRVDDDRVLLIGARSPAGLVGLSGELLELNAKQAALLRSLHDRRTAGRPSDFAEFARMNNELVTAQRQLVKTNAALAEASKEKNRLIGMASHDLRSPLAVIRSLSDVLLDRDLSVDVDRRRELLERIRRSSDFMLSLIDEMLQLTTIDAGEMRLTRKPTDIAGLVREAVDVQAVLADDKDIRIRTRLASGLPEIEVDGRKLEQVLSNLIGNAIKFSDRGRSVEVTLEGVDRADPDGRRGVRISVKDEGPGIPAEEMEDLFQPFHQTSVRAPDGEPGAGLGLAIASRIVEAHGGRLRCESVVDTGSTFYFELAAPA